MWKTSRKGDLMTSKLYCVRDVVGDVFMPPFPAKNDSAAVRSFMKALEKQDHPEDFELIAVGNFDADSGELESLVSYKVNVPVESAADG